MQGVAAESSLLGIVLENKYRILRVIGRGGMGEVYEAEHTTLGKRVAIKLMLEKYQGDGEAVARFQREALAASRIGNPHIIDVGDIGTAPDGRSFVVMELLTGKPLSRVIEEGGPMPPQRAIAIMRQVLRAVGAAHAKGIVHRDLKPDNIFLLEDQGDTRDFVKLLDFGISKVIDPDMEAAATKLTTTGVVMGTPLYMAPEQAMGHEIDHHADVYACGVIMYEMLAGRPPFEGQTYAVLVAKVLTSEAPLLSDLRPGLAPKLVAAVHRALEKEPERRFSTAEAFANALPQPTSASALELGQTMQSGQRAVAAHTLGGAQKRKFPVVAVVIAGALGIASAAVVIVAKSAGSTSEQPGKSPVQVTPIDDPTPAATRMGTLEISSEPTGATIIIDGQARGVTPKTLELPVGEHAVRLELAGHEPLERVERIETSKTRSVTPFLRPAQAAAGTTATGKPEKKPAKPSPSKAVTKPPADGARAVDTSTPYDDPPPKTVARPPVDDTPPPPPVKPTPKDTPKAPPAIGSPKDNPYK